MKLTITGTAYFAALSDIEPESVTPVGYGCRVTLVAPDAKTREEWIDRMISVASDLAWDGEKAGVVEQIYKDVERADIAAGRPVLA